MVSAAGCCVAIFQAGIFYCVFDYFICASSNYSFAQSCFIRKASCLKMAFIALGRTAGVDKITGVEWVQLERPELPEAEDNITAIVADLHSPQLGEEWQRFLAYCSLQHIPVYNIRQVEESLTGRVKIHHMYENNLGSFLPSSRYMLFK